MPGIEQDVRGLKERDNGIAHACLKRLERQSAQGDAVYAFWDAFVAMLEDGHSYVRTRGLQMLAANARWDTGQKVEAVLPAYCAHILDEKPITARQCIQHLAKLVEGKPQLVSYARQALCQADVSRYADSMQPLLRRDVQKALAQLDEQILPEVEQGDQKM